MVGRAVELSNGQALGIAARRMDGTEAHGQAGDRLRVHPHPVFFASTLSFVAFVAFVAALILAHNELAVATQWQVVGWAVLVAAASCVGPVLRWSRTWVELEGRQLRCASGLVRRQVVDLDLDRAERLTVRETAPGRWLGYVRLYVVDEGGAGHEFPPVAPLDAFRGAAARTARRPGRRDARRDG